MNKNAIFLSKFKKLVFYLLIICCCFGATGHTIRWHVGDEVIETTTCDAGDTITPPNVPAMSGRTFAGWSDYTIKYRPLEYINFEGTQYVDTGVVVDSTFDTLGYDFKILATSTNSFVYGSSTSSYGTATGALSLSNGYFVGNSRVSSTVRTANTEYTINVTIIRNNNTLAYNENGITGGGQYSGDIIQQNSIAIGGIHTNSYEWNFLGRIYYFTIKKNGATIKRYQPAQRLSDGAYGFYEMVSGTFVIATGGVFTSGGPAVE